MNNRKKARKGLKIVIVGCGKIGSTLTEKLYKEGHDITVVDTDSERLQSMAEQYDVMGIEGNGASFQVQREAGVESADLFIAVTDKDELNLLCCTVAHFNGKCAAIARVRNPEYNTELQYIKEELGLAMVINQEQTAAREIARLMRFPSAIEIDTFAKGRIELLKVRIPDGSILDGMALMNMHAQLKCNVLVCAVQRGKDIVIPKGDYVLQTGDIISIVSGAGEDEAFFKKVGIHQNKVKNVMIVGGGDIAYYLVQLLGTYGIRVKLIEIKAERCEELWNQLPKATIIHGDGTSKTLLEEEGMDQVDGFVALTGIDEENVILSLYARKLGIRKIVTKINHITFDEVIDSLDLDTIIAPQNLTAEYILQYVRARANSMGSNVETLHRIVDNRAEALEFFITEKFSKKNIPLQQLSLKPNILIACIYRKGKVILPRGGDVMAPGDGVIIVTTDKGLNGIMDIFEE